MSVELNTSFGVVREESFEDVNVSESDTDKSDALEDGEPFDDIVDAFDGSLVALFAVLHAEEGVKEIGEVLLDTTIDRFDPSSGRSLFSG